MTLWRRVRSWWVFLVCERVGYRRPSVLGGHQLTEADRILHDIAEREKRIVRATLRYLDAQADVFRRPE